MKFLKIGFAAAVLSYLLAGLLTGWATWPVYSIFWWLTP